MTDHEFIPSPGKRWPFCQVCGKKQRRHDTSRADLLADLNEAICELEASTSPSAAGVAKRLEAHVERIER